MAQWNPFEDEKNQGVGPNGQPLPDAKPSISGDMGNYDENAALVDAKKLRKAMKGLGTDEASIIDVLGCRNAEQRKMIDKAFRFVDNKNRDLYKDLKSELGGNIEDLVLGLMEEPGLYDAKLILNACSGVSYDEDVLIEVLCTRTNTQIKLMQQAWTTHLKQKESMKERVSDETKKLMGNSSFQKLCESILDCKRKVGVRVDEEVIKAHAEELNRMVSQDKKKDAKEKFVQIFSLLSWQQIAGIYKIFTEISKKYTLPAAIEKAFGDGNTAKAMQTIVDFATQPYDFWAKKLRESMKGMGTKDKLLKRIIITRCEVDLLSVSSVFSQRYGDGKTLAHWIKKDTGGDYEKMLLAILGSSD